MFFVEGYDKDNDAFVFDFQHDSETDLVKIVLSDADVDLSARIEKNISEYLDK